MIKNYIFDFGNVITEFVPKKMTRPYADSDEECKVISDVVFDRLYWDRLDNGTITDEEVKDGIRSRLPKELHQKAINTYDNWMRNMEPICGMQKLVADISESGAKLFLLSNISIQFANGYVSVPWIKEVFDKFAGLVFSGPIGLLKPNKEIFEYLMNKYGLKPEECMFIDDTKKNVEGAEAVGIKGYLFDGDAQKLREYINL